MLGEQLIKNDLIALVELVKNSYDADADTVEMRFENFNDDMSVNENSSIVIEDDGSGMTPKDIRESWMNPAAPQKYILKKEGKGRTKKGRIIQGEKGIGRFAILKLGKKVTISTRTANSTFESLIEYDFTKYDADFTMKDGAEEEIFLDEIEIDYSEYSPPKLIKKSHGTVIAIQDLKGSWGGNVIGKLRKDISNLTDPISRITRKIGNSSFQVSIFCNGKEKYVEDENEENFKGLIENNAVLKIKGEYNSEKNAFVFTENENQNREIEIKLNVPKITGLWIWRKRFGTNKKVDEEDKKYKCGSFYFHFNIFDFSRGISGKYELNQKQKNVLKGHRVYLYRDGVRVYPYGDPDDDWLEIDVTRGTGRAGDFFSNAQIIGWIDISHENNPNLRDKTNREGLIEKGNAVKDFIFLVSTFLSYIKQNEYARYEQKKVDKKKNEIVQNEVVANRLTDLKKHLEEKGYESSVRKVVNIQSEYKLEKNYLVRRAEITEDLAGVGLSVEMTSHDIMLMMSRAEDIAKDIAKSSRKSRDEKTQQQAEMLVGVLTQIADGMQDIQSIFKSSRRRKKNLKIEPVLDKIYSLYKSLLNERGIHFEKEILPGSPLVADTTDGVIMQVLINLFDNASYWLNTVDKKHKEVKVLVNGGKGEILFADNGPGIDKEDLPYIFEPFYSGKGQEGRGLGLYIARQLLDRHDYSISVVEKDKILPGANFVISFYKEDD